MSIFLSLYNIPAVCGSFIKPAFHDADTDTDSDNLADILARIVARMSACCSACHRNNFRKSRVSDSDVSAWILARMSVSLSVSSSWNARFISQVHSHRVCLTQMTICKTRYETRRSFRIEKHSFYTPVTRALLQVSHIPRLRLRVGIPSRYVTNPTPSTQPCIPRGR